MILLISIYPSLIKKGGKVTKQGILLEMKKILKAIIIKPEKTKTNKKLGNL